MGEDNRDILQRAREQRLATLALAVQIAADRWREPVLPGDQSVHEVLSHLLAWDEWAVAIFEVSRLRPLPASLTQAPRDVDAFNARAVTRYQGLSHDDILAGLEVAVDRVIYSATLGGEGWDVRRLTDLARPAAPGEDAKPAPKVRSILRQLTDHEAAHSREIGAAFGIQPDVERFQANGNGVRDAATQGGSAARDSE